MTSDLERVATAVDQTDRLDISWPLSVLCTSGRYKSENNQRTGGKNEKHLVEGSMHGISFR